MIKRLASIALLSLPISLLFTASASAAECATVGVLASCSEPSSSSPSSSPQPQPSSQPAQQPAPQPTGTIAEEPGAAARILSLVNNDRAAAGLGALAPRSPIESIAQGHSRDMAGRKTIWHNDAYFTESTRRSLNARGLGENVAMNSSVDDAHRRLMASPGHRANILKDSFDAVGISVVRDERGMFYVTQNFVDSATATAPPSAPRASAAIPRPVKVAAPAAPAPKNSAVVTAQPAALSQAAPATSPAELDATLPAAPVTGESPSGSSPTASLGAALAALVGALAALVRLG